MDSVYTFNHISQLVKELKGKKVVVVGGCFDLLHLGHIIFLQKAKQQGEVVVVLLESDQTIKKFKGEKRPIHSQKIRAQLLSELKSVDAVLLLPELKTDQEYDQVIEVLHPSVIATTKGDEYDFHKKRQAKKVGAKVMYVTGLITDHSTTNIIKKIRR